MPRRHGAWIRYGTPLSAEQIDFAIEHYQVAILQPWEEAAAARMKTARPDMSVLVYKCLSSARSNEPGPILPSGVSYAEAEESGEHWFAHREDGSRISWNGYDHHYQMAVWDPDYQQRWVDNVTEALADSPFDGVMADNDVFDDYYGLQPPIEGGRTMADIRAALDQLVPAAGAALNGINKILVPNIAEARREPGRWARHAAYGGGFDEVWLAWGTGEKEYLDPDGARAQAEQAIGPGLTIFRTATDGTTDHPNVLYGLAAFWIFGGAAAGAYAATGHDQYSITPFVPQMSWDMGEPLEEPVQRGNSWSRTFAHGWAAVNLNSGTRRTVRFSVPAGMQDNTGAAGPSRVTLLPHQGAMFLRFGVEVPGA